MYSVLKNKIKNTSFGIKAFYSVNCAKWLLYSTIQLEKSRIKSMLSHLTKYPKTIQLPITYHCNYDCVMCGMQNLKNLKDFSPKDLEEILSDRLFTKIQYVGVNGGEPFIKSDLEDYIRVLIEKLPKLTDINVISNGYFTERILSKLRVIHSMCEEKGIKLNVSFSIDGINDMQDFHRGCKGAWEKICNTLSEIRKDQSQYCDSINIICTITKYNVFRLTELESWANANKYKVTYNLATVHARIDNYTKEKDFSIFADEEATYMAREFFYKKATETNDPRYYGLYLYIRDHKRYAPCPCQYNKWVTVTPNCYISYCATHSIELGNGQKESPYEIFNGNIPYLKTIIDQYCPTCSHYMSSMSAEGWRIIQKERLNQIRTF